MPERPRPDMDHTRDALRRHDERAGDDPEEDGSAEEPAAAEEDAPADEPAAAEEDDEEEPGTAP